MGTRLLEHGKVKSSVIVIDIGLPCRPGTYRDSVRRGRFYVPTLVKGHGHCAPGVPLNLYVLHVYISRWTVAGWYPAFCTFLHRDFGGVKLCGSFPGRTHVCSTPGASGQPW
jgi:hypothetical protein